ncbi:MAG TPA: alpha/beta hydrolase [Polyangiaceae bacterium]
MKPGEREFFVEAVDGTRLYTHIRLSTSDLVSPALESAPDPAPSKNTHAERPLLVLCDGLCCDGFIYKYLWDDLAALGSVAHFHYRGHGRSELPQDPARIDVVALAQDLLTVLDHLEAEQVVLFGHSLGTQVVLEAYRRRPEAIRALILMCGSFGRVTHTFKGSNLLATVLPDLIEWVTRHPKFARALWARVPVNVALRVAGLIGDINIRAVRVEDVAPYFQHVIHVDFEMFLRMLKCAGEHSAEDLLPRVNVPTLVIAGARDTITPADLSKAMSDAIPNAKLCLLPDGTHVAPLEHRQAVADAIQGFLNESAVLRSGGAALQDPELGS